MADQAGMQARLPARSLMVLLRGLISRAKSKRQSHRPLSSQKMPPVRVAIFSAERRLTFHNEAYRGLWQLDEEWLKSGPLDGAILDRLRDDGRLPDVANYREWKSRLLACYMELTEVEDWWHLKSGRVVHVAAERRPDGGVTYFYDDKTEALALERRYVALTRVRAHEGTRP